MNKQWFETWFDCPYYHRLYERRDDREAAAFMLKLIAFLQAGPKAEFLDLACGKGRHSVFLHSLGYRVDGADYSRNSINEARRHLAPGLRFFQHDMREVIPGAYDYILNLFTSFGYFSKDEEHLQTIRNIYNALKSGGTFVLDYMNCSRIDPALNQYEEIQQENILFKIKKERTAGFIVKQIEFEADGEIHYYEEKVRDFDLNSFRKLFHKSGLKISSIFGNYRLDPFDPENSDRLILIANK